MAIVAVKTFSWHSIRPATLARLPVAETLVMLITVAATVYTANLAIGVVAGVIAMLLLPRIVRRKNAATAEVPSPAPEKITRPGVNILTMPDSALSGTIVALRGTRYRITRGGVTFVAGEFG